MILGLLFILFMAITITYLASYYLSPDRNQQSYLPTDGEVDDEDIASEINDVFISDEDEIEIGEMIE